MQHPRLDRESPGDGNPLPLPTRELVRVLVDELLGRLQRDPAQQIENALLEVVATQPVDEQRPAEDVADVVGRVEGRERILQHQLDRPPVLLGRRLVQVHFAAVEDTGGPT